MANKSRLAFIECQSIQEEREPSPSFEVEAG